MDEKEFDKRELKESFDNYKDNGYLIMICDTFINGFMILNLLIQR